MEIVTSFAPLELRSPASPFRVTRAQGLRSWGYRSTVGFLALGPLGSFGPRRRGLRRRAQRIESYYEILGVSSNANEREIKSSFRRLARQYHPDVNQEPGALEKFQQIAKAYEILSDSRKREQYNQFGDGAVADTAPDLSSMDLKDILGDVFQDFFGPRKAPKRAPKKAAKKGADLQCKIEIPFHVACFGGSYSIQVNREETCKTCAGQGVNSDLSKHHRCSKCNGTGATLQVMQTPLGVMQTHLVCPKCGGTGVDPLSLCRSCGGKGTQTRARDIDLSIPAGSNMGSVLRIRGEGDKGVRGGAPGDLYVTLRISRSRDFVRDGTDVYNEKVISVFDAMLGTSVKVNTVDGHAEIQVPAGTQPGTTMRLRGRGVPKLGGDGQRGDHYVTMRVEVPHKLTDVQRELVARLKQACE